MPALARRRLSPREWIVCSLLVSSVSLASFENLSGVTTSQRELVLALLLLGVVLAVPGGRLRTTFPRIVAVGLFVASTVVSYLRFANAPIPPVTARTMTGLAVMLSLVTVFALCALLAPANADTRRRRLRCALYAPVCFAALNLGFYIVGYHFHVSEFELKGNNGSAELLELIGVHTTRVSLPLSPGLNGAGEAGTLALVICAVLARRERGRQRMLAIGGVCVGVASILLTDSRGPLVYGLLALLILALLPKWSSRGVLAVPVLLPISPTIILFVASHLGSLGESFNRGQNNGSFETATGRSHIWSTVVEFLGHWHLQDIIGYGAYGQVRSGVSAQYVYLFRGKPYAEFTSVHNLALQTILDSGYVGLVLLLVFLVVAVNSARISHQREGTPESAALLVALIAMSLFGASEALPGLAGIYLLAAAIVLAAAAIRTPAIVRRPVRVDREPSRRLAVDGRRALAIPQALAR